MRREGGRERLNGGGGDYGSFMTSTCHPVHITSLAPHTLSVFFSIHVSKASSG